ncbi:MAG: hypothetical protein ABIG61_05255 [Planctomycetota bacterium]
MSVTAISIGRARTVLVLGADDSAKAVISSVVAGTSDETKSKRISFVGDVIFENSAIEHVEDVLIPIVDNVLDLLGVAKKSFVISVVNPGGVAISNLRVNISGFSVDVPMLVAMLSAALNIPAADDIVSTGHITSSGGDITVVKAMSIKISAALDDKSIHHFIYPAIDKDRSLGVLSPVETEDAEVAVINAKGRLKMTAVNNIADLIKAVFADEGIVLSSLQEGFFAVDGSARLGGNSISSLVRFLTENNGIRFWDVLERYFHAVENENAKRLLLAYSQFHIRNKTYPGEFGRELIQLLRSLPPDTRNDKIEFPVLPTLECVKLTQFAAESDTEDIRLLYDATAGKAIWTEPAIITRPKPAGTQIKDDKDQALVDSIISQIDSTNLAKIIGVPIDTGRATYRLNSLMVKSNEEFHGVVTGFYLHLERHMHPVSESVDMNRVRDDAVALVERTFADKGGVNAAMNEACDAIHGGMKFILDCLTEQFKTECQSKHVNRVLRDALGSLNREARVSFISALLKRLSSHLPHEITMGQPERFVEHYEIIVKAYVKSLDKINEVFRRF